MTVYYEPFYLLIFGEEYCIIYGFTFKALPGAVIFNYKSLTF